jgi:hypothetical protein
MTSLWGVLIVTAYMCAALEHCSHQKGLTCIIWSTSLYFARRSVLLSLYLRNLSRQQAGVVRQPLPSPASDVVAGRSSVRRLAFQLTAGNNDGLNFQCSASVPEAKKTLARNQNSTHRLDQVCGVPSPTESPEAFGACCSVSEAVANERKSDLRKAVTHARLIGKRAPHSQCRGIQAHRSRRLPTPHSITSLLQNLQSAQAMSVSRLLSSSSTYIIDYLLTLRCSSTLRTNRSVTQPTRRTGAFADTTPSHPPTFCRARFRSRPSRERRSSPVATKVWRLCRARMPMGDCSSSLVHAQSTTPKPPSTTATD